MCTWAEIHTGSLKVRCLYFRAKISSSSVGCTQMGSGERKRVPLVVHAAQALAWPACARGGIHIIVIISVALNLKKSLRVPRVFFN
jgi:hypothetical protein